MSSSLSSTPPNLPVTRLLAEFVASTSWSALPAAVQNNTRAALVNGLANIVGGTHDACIERLLAVFCPFMGPRRASLPGRAQPVDVPTAAFLNAVSANVLDFDDTHVPSLVHPTAAVLPPLLALAEDLGHDAAVSGEQLLVALALGTEVACRLGMAMHPEHYDHGWHTTTTCGVVGAAAGSARLMGLNAEQTAHALGIAAQSASGLIENLSTMAKSVGVGNAAKNGLLAACMAREGVAAAPASLEGPFGFLRVLAERPDVDAAIGALGNRWALLQRFAKPYPSCALSFPAIDGALELWSRPGFLVSEVRRIRVTGHPLMLVRAGRARVSTGREAKLSIPHSVAIALLHGSAGVQDYLDSTVNDPRTVALSAMVECESDRSMAADQARVCVELQDGGVLESHITRSRGTPARPLTDDELSAKAVGLLAFAAPQLEPEEAVAAMWRVEHLTDVRELLVLLVPGTPMAQCAQAVRVMEAA